MIRTVSLLAVVVFAHSAICNSAFADPDNSFVWVTLDTKASTSAITASGFTRVDVVGAVFCAVENCKFPTDGVTVGPWLRFPQNVKNIQDGTPQLTVCLGQGIEGGTSTAYIAITPKFPFAIVTAITTELRTCGVTDVRLLSHDEASEIMADLSNFNGQTQPSVQYLRDDIQFFPAGPEIQLPSTHRARED
ncbi:MAG TPA: hypothetical protein VNQ76_09525 [Planctomicrobium sp.]|nr:hypothetical protein [Planctomicrobium sp.]